MIQSSAIYNLSNEVLEQIFGDFCLHCRADCQLPAPTDAYFRGTEQQCDSPSWYALERQALFSLCLVSRQFRDIAQSVLYHEFTLGYGDSWKSIAYRWDRRLTSFMRTVARRPDLARRIKRALIHHYLIKTSMSAMPCGYLMRRCAGWAAIHHKLECCEYMVASAKIQRG
ncbi:hypothetical protein V8C42DRAFT_311965 [Trichoderma barbatum]